MEKLADVDRLIFLRNETKEIEDPLLLGMALRDLDATPAEKAKILMDRAARDGDPMPDNVLIPDMDF